MKKKTLADKQAQLAQRQKDLENLNIPALQSELTRIQKVQTDAVQALNNAHATADPVIQLAQTAQNNLDKANSDLADAKNLAQQAQDALTQARKKKSDLDNALTALSQAQDRQNEARLKLAQAQDALTQANDALLTVKNEENIAQKNFDDSNATYLEAKAKADDAHKALDEAQKKYSTMLAQDAERKRKAEAEAKAKAEAEAHPTVTMTPMNTNTTPSSTTASHTLSQQHTAPLVRSAKASAATSHTRHTAKHSVKTQGAGDNTLAETGANTAFMTILATVAMFFGISTTVASKHKRKH